MKLWKNRNLRFRLASNYVNPGESVLDLCGGFGELKDFLPHGCSYTCVDASKAFQEHMKQKHIDSLEIDLRRDLRAEDFDRSFNVITVLISLCQFRYTGIKPLLEKIKLLGTRVILIEEVIPGNKKQNPAIKWVMNYLSSTDFTSPYEKFSKLDFIALLKKHGYTPIEAANNYVIGLYG